MRITWLVALSVVYTANTSLCGAESTAKPSTFINPIYEGADPWVTKHDGHYCLCASEGNRGISVWKSNRITDPGIKRVVWNAPNQGWNSHQVWAPELHNLDGRWYIYYAASDGRNENHRTGVLEATTKDPQGPYRDRGVLYTGDNYTDGSLNRWAIDATPLKIGDKLYLVWSGWADDQDIQYLYVAPMTNPWTVGGNRVRICANDDYLWERVAEDLSQRGLNEGPQVLKHDGRIFIVYSCSGSWEPTYKLGLLELKARDPLRPESWHKHNKPVFQPTDKVFGVGHASFTKSPDDRQDWIIFHAKLSQSPGWHRAVWTQPFTWGSNGLPSFGSPIPPGTSLSLPSGEVVAASSGPYRDMFNQSNWDNWIYYGFKGGIRASDGKLHLGASPPWGQARDKSGEKALVRGRWWADAVIQVKIYVEDGQRDAGILFRVSEPALGYDAQKGYFAGIIPGTEKVVLGKTDGRNWQELALASHPITTKTWYTLRVESIGSTIRVAVDNQMKIELEDTDHSQGMAGLRVVDTHARFDDLQITPQ